MVTHRGKGHKSAALRVSVTLPAHVHDTLEHIAHEKKVSVAWVMRDAVEKYIADKWPLFAQSQHEENHGN